MPACAEVNRAMQELSGAKYSTNEQNKETGKSRQRRDMKDTHTPCFAQCLKEIRLLRAQL